MPSGNGLYVRPPVDGEKRPRNWLDHESLAVLAQMRDAVLAG